jgi:solute carrier family 35 protein E3
VAAAPPPSRGRGGSRGIGIRISMSATAYAVGNVASSVALVLVNKKVFSGGFHYPMTLSFFHFVFTVIWYQLLAATGAYTRPPPGQGMPSSEKFKVAAAGFASIGFMNLSLNANSVGFYQITKLTIIPVTLVINAMCYGVFTSAKIKIALTILLAGVAVSTVTDVQLRAAGLCWGTLAVLSTAVFQIWQGTKQKEFNISATQLQAGIAMWQSIQALAVSAASEMYCWNQPTDGSACDTATVFFQEAIGGNGGHQHTLWIVLSTCFLALAVNLCSFGLIGKTSPITFQVSERPPRQPHTPAHPQRSSTEERSPTNVTRSPFLPACSLSRAHAGGGPREDVPRACRWLHALSRQAVGHRTADEQHHGCERRDGRCDPLWPSQARLWAGPARLPRPHLPRLHSDHH